MFEIVQICSQLVLTRSFGPYLVLFLLEATRVFDFRFARHFHWTFCERAYSLIKSLKPVVDFVYDSHHVSNLAAILGFEMPKISPSMQKVGPYRFWRTFQPQKAAQIRKVKQLCSGAREEEKFSSSSFCVFSICFINICLKIKI